MRKLLIGNYIREYRNRKGYSLRQLAEKIGLSHSFIGDIEANRSRPSYENLIKLIVELNIPIDKIFLSNKYINEDIS